MLGAVGIVAAGVAVNLPETADQRLADTVEEAEEFGRGQVTTVESDCNDPK